MSTVNELISLSQFFAWVTSAQVSDVVALKCLNLAYHDIEEVIRNEIDEDYFYDYFTTDTKLNQSEYNFASIDPTSTVPWILKIISVGIKFRTSDTDYRVVYPFGSGSLSNTPEYLSRNQSQWSPFYIYKDSSVFIYPAPDNNGNTSLTDGNTVIAWGLRVHASVSLIDLIAWGAETTVKIPRNHHKAIAQKAVTYINNHRSLGGTSIALDAVREANTAIQWVIDNLRDRTLSPMEQATPVLTWIMY